MADINKKTKSEPLVKKEDEKEKINNQFLIKDIYISQKLRRKKTE